jgi:hypothetical protein
MSPALDPNGPAVGEGHRANNLQPQTRTAAYSSMGEAEKAKAITRENLHQNPNYLFARINQAQIYLASKEYNRIPELFEAYV